MKMVPGFNVEEIPQDLLDEIDLPHNGGNCLCVDLEDGEFAKWVGTQVEFPPSGWMWIVVWR